MLQDIEIARQAKMLPVKEVAAELNIPSDAIIPYGHWKSKISLDYCQSIQERPNGKLILVTAITPTPAGEGKTTTCIGLTDALRKIGKKSVVCLREPSMGPCFGIKGGAAGGGYSQVVPMEDINLHFTGDFHAISAAHNLLSAMVDNHIHHGNRMNLDPRLITWGRVLDMNDRTLRKIVIGLGGTANGIPRESTFDITVASEVMAIFCLSENLMDLKQRLGKIIVGRNTQKEYVTAADINANGAMTVLLKDALQPNLVQTLENTPALIHGGPFANIAHGCNSLIATKLGLKIAEYTVTEAGFGADLGAEKFLDIKCRKMGVHPDAVVLVATIRALKYHGGMALADLHQPDTSALEKGIENLKKHLENIHRFGLPAVVALNVFQTDSKQELQMVTEKCASLGVRVVQATHHQNGSAGAEELARVVVDVVENTPTNFSFLYPDSYSLWDKVRVISQEIYGATEIQADRVTQNKFQQLQEKGFGDFPICMAKTQYSLSADPQLRARPQNFNIPVRDVKVSAGAGFVVVYLGDIMTMPGLPKIPSAEKIDISPDGNIMGLF
ncbi:MAG: formate--tetrahydrofolate ligase [Planctomycetia bacterium]|nr:formate--tetrahydrofolate ligase [Planctomycetia bacterium]